jgi:hypothetical protein
MRKSLQFALAAGSMFISMVWRAPVFPHTWDVQAVAPFTLEETRAPDRASKPN